MGSFSSTATVVAQSSDPGAIGAGSIWSDTGNEVLNRRNDANDGWISQSPIGMIVLFGGLAAAIPTGWVRCDGAAISRTTFNDLFDVIATEWGIGDGSTTFNVPDFETSNRFPRAAEQDSEVSNTGGTDTVALTIAEMPAHAHTLNSDSVYEAGINRTGPLTTAGTGATTTSVGSGDAHENKPLFVSCFYIIRTD